MVVDAAAALDPLFLFLLLVVDGFCGAAAASSVSSLRAFFFVAMLSVAD